jgi:hypothetical protein
MMILNIFIYIVYKLSLHYSNKIQKSMYSSILLQ